MGFFTRRAESSDLDEISAIVNNNYPDLEKYNSKYCRLQRAPAKLRFNSLEDCVSSIIYSEEFDRGKKYNFLKKKWLKYKYTREEEDKLNSLLNNYTASTISRTNYLSNIENWMQRDLSEEEVNIVRDYSKKEDITLLNPLYSSEEFIFETDFKTVVELYENTLRKKATQSEIKYLADEVQKRRYYVLNYLFGLIDESSPYQFIDSTWQKREKLSDKLLAARRSFLKSFDYDEKINILNSALKNSINLNELQQAIISEIEQQQIVAINYLSKKSNSDAYKGVSLDLKKIRANLSSVFDPFERELNCVKIIRRTLSDSEREDLMGSLELDRQTAIASYTKRKINVSEALSGLESIIFRKVKPEEIEEIIIPNIREEVYKNWKYESTLKFDERQKLLETAFGRQLNSDEFNLEISKLIEDVKCGQEYLKSGFESRIDLIKDAVSSCKNKLLVEKYLTSEIIDSHAFNPEKVFPEIERVLNRQLTAEECYNLFNDNIDKWKNYIISKHTSSSAHSIGIIEGFLKERGLTLAEDEREKIRTRVLEIKEAERKAAEEAARKAEAARIRKEQEEERKRAEERNSRSSQTTSSDYSSSSGGDSYYSIESSVDRINYETGQVSRSNWVVDYDGNGNETGRTRLGPTPNYDAGPDDLPRD